MTAERLFLLFGGVNMFLAVALGAFGAHGLKHRLTSEMLAVFNTAVEYHFYHALGLLLVGTVCARFEASNSLKASGWCMLLGMLLFSGSLYALSLTGVKGFGAITPVGGLCFLASWVLFVSAIWRQGI